jgi:hypothetical protein
LDLQSLVAAPGAVRLSTSELRPAGPGIGPAWFGGPRFGDSWGSTLIGTINNGLNLAGLDISQKQIMRGFIAVELARKK